MNSYSFYHKETGVIHPKQLGTDDPSQVPGNTPADHIAIEGHYDHLCTRVDVDLHRQFLALQQEPELPYRDQEPQRDPAPRQAKLDALWANVLVDYQPPAPSADHEWDGETKRWRLSAATTAKAQARAAALVAIAALETQGIRPMRELTLGLPGAQERLASIDSQIAALRASL
jgi:hypothetical protein